MSNAAYALIVFAPGTNKGSLLSYLQSRIAGKMTDLDSSERSDAVLVLREAIGEVKASWINAKPAYDRPSGKLVLKFDEQYVENRASLKRFFQFWRNDPGVDISFTRNSTAARAFMPTMEVV